MLSSRDPAAHPGRPAVDRDPLGRPPGDGSIPAPGWPLTAQARAQLYSLLRQELEQAWEAAVQRGATPSSVRSALDERLRALRSNPGGSPLGGEDLEHGTDHPGHLDGITEGR